MSRLDWTAVLAGAALAVALLVAVRPLSGETGLAWVAANGSATLAGAYTAGRFSTRPNALHGVTVWSVAVIALLLLSLPTGGSAVRVSIADPGIDALLARADSLDGVQTQLRQLIADPSHIDRASLIRAIAAQAGIPEDQATARLTQFEGQARRSAIWRFAALMIGLGAAWFGGSWGATRR
jgi:hypothetical protein